MTRGELNLSHLSHEIKLSSYSHGCAPQIGRIYEKLSEMFKNPTPATDEIGRALEVSPHENKTAHKSHNLFHVVMQAPISLACAQERRWDASHLIMYGAYKWDKFLLWIKNPQDILSITLTRSPEVVKTRVSPIRTHCVRWHRGPQALRSHRAFLRPRHLLRVQGRQTVPVPQGRPILPPYDRRQMVQHSSSDHRIRSDEELVR